MKNNNLKPENSIYQAEFVKELFNKMSASYERMNYITSFGFSIRWRKQFLNIFKNDKSEVKILDLMCGMGETWSFIQKKFPNAEIHALDFSDEMLKKASEKNNKKFQGKIKILKQDVLKNNLESNIYDYVICAYGLKTFNDEQTDQLAKEVYRILKTDGKFSFLEVSEPKTGTLKFFYEFYLKNVIPVLGKIFLGDPDQYRMLWRYTSKYKNSEKAFRIFNENQLKTECQNYFFGCASGISGTKKHKNE